MRQAFAEWLDEVGPSADDRAGVELAVGEAATNAVEHAYPPGQPSPIRFEAKLLPDGILQVQVADQGRWREPAPGDTSRGRGLLLGEQLAAHQHELTLIAAPDSPARTVLNLVGLPHSSAADRAGDDLAAVAEQ